MSTQIPDDVRAALRWLALSAHVERGIVVLGILAGIATGVAAWRMRRAPRPAGEPISPGREGLLIGAILIVAALLRLTFASSPYQPRWFFAESTVVAAEARLRHETPWLGQWRGLLAKTQISWAQESAILAPVDVAAVAIAGPSIELPLYVGALWGVLGVGLAWLLGRSAVSVAFALVFAALVAVAPLQITWARLGGIQICSVTHLLLVLWTSHRAGARASIALALLAGLLSWASMYHYYAARVAIPLAPLAVLAGARTRAPGSRLRTAVGITLVLAVGFVLVGWSLAGRDVVAQLWPRHDIRYGGRTPRELLAGVLADPTQHLRATLRSFFWTGRTQSPAAAWSVPSEGDRAIDWGFASGGLCLLPIVLLGVIGLAGVGTLRAWYLWGALLLAGLSLPVLSITTARRLLILDLAWCALAAHGCLVLGRLPPIADLSSSRRLALVSAVLLALGVWSGAGLAMVCVALPSYHGAAIPFGEAGFGDGITCPGCARDGLRWQEETARGNLVVLFDSDLAREDPTAPGGLELYGRVGALAVGESRRFEEFYALLQNVDWTSDPPNMRPRYDGTMTPLQYLDETVRRTQPESIVWEFRHPTRWEYVLADRLEDAGGSRVPIATPSLAERFARTPEQVLPSLQVRTPRSAWSQTLDVLEGMLGPNSRGTACATLESRARQVSDEGVLGVQASSRRAGNTPQWFVTGWHHVYVGGDALPFIDPVAVSVEETASARVLHVLERDGSETHGLDGRSRIPSLPHDIGRGCAVFVGGSWWVVDAVNGQLYAGNPPPWPLPRGAWTGVAATAEKLILASAEQQIHVIDVATGSLLGRFDAVVPPGSMLRPFGSCSPIAAGDGWIALLQAQTSLLDIYDESGVPLARTNLRTTAGIFPGALSLAGSGRFLAVGHDSRVETFELRRTGACEPKPSLEPGQG